MAYGNLALCKPRGSSKLYTCLLEYRKELGCCIISVYFTLSLTNSAPLVHTLWSKFTTLLPYTKLHSPGNSLTNRLSGSSSFLVSFLSPCGVCTTLCVRISLRSLSALYTKSTKHSTFSQAESLSFSLKRQYCLSRSRSLAFPLDSLPDLNAFHPVHTDYPSYSTTATLVGLCIDYTGCLRMAPRLNCTIRRRSRSLRLQRQYCGALQDISRVLQRSAGSNNCQTRLVALE